MFANTQCSGTDAGLPDVCLTPTPAGPMAPMPYPNRASGNMGVKATYKVLMAGAPAHTLATSVPMTQGDNAGVGTGVGSGTVMGPSRHVSGATTVLLGSMPASRLTSATLQNSTNCPGARVSPSQTKVVLLAP